MQWPNKDFCLFCSTNLKIQLLTKKCSVSTNFSFSTQIDKNLSANFIAHKIPGVTKKIINHVTEKSEIP